MAASNDLMNLTNGQKSNENFRKWFIIDQVLLTFPISNQRDVEKFLEEV